MVVSLFAGLLSMTEVRAWGLRADSTRRCLIPREEVIWFNALSSPPNRAEPRKLKRVGQKVKSRTYLSLFVCRPSYGFRSPKPSQPVDANFQSFRNDHILVTARLVGQLGRMLEKKARNN